MFPFVNIVHDKIAKHTEIFTTVSMYDIMSSWEISYF
jgi:hypothetical protein